MRSAGVLARIQVSTDGDAVDFQVSTAHWIDNSSSFRQDAAQHSTGGQVQQPAVIDRDAVSCQHITEENRSRTMC
jgi:hypothetical protein